MSKAEFMVIDIGSTFTKLRVFKDAVCLAGTQVPTTLHNIVEGITSGQRELQETYDVSEASKTIATSSAAGGLRMVAMGYMTRVTAKAAKEVAMNAGARVLEVISQDHDAEYRVEILREINPDIVLLGGGADSGDETSLQDNAEVLVQSGIKTKVILSGNKKAQPYAADILEQSGIEYVRVPNIMPTIHELVVKEARAAIHREFIKQITHAEGTKHLMKLLTNKTVTPTPGAVLMGAELMARGIGEDDRPEGLLVIDLGGATTDIHSILPRLEEMPIEEKGLIVSNEKHAVYRTVEGNLGMRVSAEGILEIMEPAELLKRKNLHGEDKAVRFKEYIDRVSKKTSYIPQDSEEEIFERLLAEAAVEIALKRHAGYFCQDANPVMGIVPGMPVGRDLRDVKKVICVGGYFQNDINAGGQIVRSVLRNRGVSLLPDENAVEIKSDGKYILFAAGAISSIDTKYAQNVLKDI